MGAFEQKLLRTRRRAGHGREIQRDEQVPGKQADVRTEHGEEEETELVS
jgi:hypothetical protein